MMRTTILATTTAAALLLGTSHSAAQEFIPIPPLPGHTQARVTALSGDGSTVVGVSGESPNERGFYWTEATGTVELPFTGDYSIAADVNYDGSVIVGWSNNSGIRWVNGVPEMLEGNEDYPTFYPGAVSDDGNIIAGRAYPPVAPFGIAARWTEDSFTDLGEIEPDTFPLTPTDITNDGSAIVGIAGEQAFKWTEATGMVGLNYLPGYMDFSTAECISGDGGVIGGQANIEFELGYVAVYWTGTDTDPIEIPSIIPSASVANAVTAINDDGSLMAGFNTGFDPAARDLFIWDPVNGERHLQTVLENDHDVDFMGWQLSGLPSPHNNEGDVYGMSNSGHELAGTTLNPMNEQRWGWLVRINPADLNLDGSINVVDLLELLAAWGTDGAGADLAAPNDVVDVSDLLALLGAWG